MIQPENFTPTIENIVSAGQVADSIDLAVLPEKLPGSSFSGKFPGAVYHMEWPRSVALVFASGKIVLTGLSDLDDIPQALRNLMDALADAGIACHACPQVGIKNIICSYDLGMPCNLVRIMMALMDHEMVEYEPESFPGLVCRISDPKMVFLIFASGKVIITGGKNMADINRGIGVLRTKLGIAGSIG